MPIQRLGPLFAFGLLLLPAGVLAQQPSTPTQDPQALSILRQCLQVGGGSQAIAAIQDFTASGSITFYWAGDEEKGSVTLKGRGLAEFRMDASVSTGIQSFVVSGSSASVKGIDGSTRTIPSDDLVYLGSPTFPLTQVELALQDGSANITLVGVVNHNGKQLDDVRVQKAYERTVDPSGYRTKLTTRDFFIDPASLQILSSEDSAHPKDKLSKTCPHEVQFSNYQAISGILVPFSITETVCGQQTSSIQLTQAAFNSGLTDSDFQP